MPRKRKNDLAVPLSEMAYRQIKEMVVTARLDPGEQVDEAALAASLSIGRTPIREALFRLVAEELVQVRPGRGFFVRSITLSDLKDLFESLLIMERAATALAARRIQDEALETLHGINRELKQAWRDGNYLQVTLHNSRFHREIYAAAGNVFLQSYLDSLQSQSQRLAYICYSRPGGTIDLSSHAELSIRDHENLMAALQERNEAAAVEVITGHIQLFHNRVLDFTSPTLLEMELIA